jgi:hypothetical protein
MIHQQVGRRSLDVSRNTQHPVGAAAGCDLLMLILGAFEMAENQQIAACGSSYFVYKTSTHIEQSISRSANVAT